MSSNKHPQVAIPGSPATETQPSSKDSTQQEASEEPTCLLVSMLEPKFLPSPGHYSTPHISPLSPYPHAQSSSTPGSPLQVL